MHRSRPDAEVLQGSAVCSWFHRSPRQLDPEAPQVQSWKAGAPLGSSWGPAVPSCQSWDPEDRRTGRDSKTRHCLKSMQWFTAGLKTNFQESIKHFWVSSDQNDFVLFQKCPLRQSCKTRKQKGGEILKIYSEKPKDFLSPPLIWEVAGETAWPNSAPRRQRGPDWLSPRACWLVGSWVTRRLAAVRLPNEIVAVEAATLPEEHFFQPSP